MSETQNRATINIMRFLVAANTISQLVGKLLGAGTTFFISLLLARRFGVEGYGDFIKITTYVAFFFLLADFGLNAVYLQKQKEEHAFGALVGLRLIGGIFLVFLSLAILAFLPKGESQGYTNIVRFGIVLFAPAIFFQAMITSANAVFQKHLRYDFAAYAIAAGMAVSLLVLFMLLRISTSAAVVGSLTLLSGSAATALVSFMGVKRLEHALTVSYSPAHTAPLLVAAVPLGLTLLFTIIYGHIDSVILTLTRNTTEVGIYGLAYKVFEFFLVLPTFFMNVMYPLMLRTENKKQIIKKSFFFLLLVSCLLSLVTWFSAPLLGEIQSGFAASTPALRVLSLSLPFFFISALCMWALIALNKQMLLVFIYGGVMILNVALNAWLIPDWGYMAAAWITLISEGLVLLVSGSFLLRYIR